jgi:hypothetical protein
MLTLLRGDAEPMLFVGDGEKLRLEDRIMFGGANAWRDMDGCPPDGDSTGWMACMTWWLSGAALVGVCARGDATICGYCIAIFGGSGEPVRGEIVPMFPRGEGDAVAAVLGDATGTMVGVGTGTLRGDATAATPGEGGRAGATGAAAAVLRRGTGTRVDDGGFGAVRGDMTLIMVIGVADRGETPCAG